VATLLLRGAEAQPNVPHPQPAGCGMTGAESTQEQSFSFVGPEQRVPVDHPLRALKALIEAVLRDLSLQFDAL
jgi:hypothetical protein